VIAPVPGNKRTAKAPAKAKPAKPTPEKTMPALELGEIRADSLYPLPTFMRLSGLNSWALRELRRRGMPILKARKRKFVSGKSFIEWLVNYNAEHED